MTTTEFDNSHDLIKISTAIHLLQSIAHDEGIEDILSKLRAKEKYLHHSFEVEDDEPVTVGITVNPLVTNGTGTDATVNKFTTNWEADEHSGQH